MKQYEIISSKRCFTVVKGEKVCLTEEVKTKDKDGNVITIPKISNEQMAYLIEEVGGWHKFIREVRVPKKVSKPKKSEKSADTAETK